MVTTGFRDTPNALVRYVSDHNFLVLQTSQAAHITMSKALPIIDECTHPFVSETHGTTIRQSCEQIRYVTDSYLLIYMVDNRTDTHVCYLLFHQLFDHNM